MKKLVVAVVLLVSTRALAREEDYRGGMVVFARDTGLWRTDPRGKGPAEQIVALPSPAADVRMIRTDPVGRTLLVDLAGTWWWTRLVPGDVVEPQQLPCAPAPARLVEDGSAVVCADAAGHALLVRLGPGTSRTFPVPAEGARIITKDGARSLIWADDRGVWRASLARPNKHFRLAPQGPSRGFLPAPDGSRAAAIYPGEIYVKKVKTPADVLDGFALDGKAARRRLYNATSTVIDWSWDSQWLLSQDDKEGACITRAVGGEYKCWKGYTAVSLAPDGSWALLLGKRAAPKDAPEVADDDKDDDEPKGESSEGGESDDDDEDDDLEPSVPVEQHSLYRAKLGGPRAAKPSLVETDIAGLGALWLPGTAAESP